MNRKKKLNELLSLHTTPAAMQLVSDAGDGALRCAACAHRCKIRPNGSGTCRVRFHDGTELRAPFGYVSGLQVDPIEKKPFHHVLSGHEALSFGMFGCNFQCPFCQNWITSQALKDERAGGGIREISVEEIMEMGVSRGARMMVSTYNEPLISSEWAHAVFSEAKRRGMLCGYVSNGHATPEVLDYLDSVVDFMNVDLKSFEESGYKRLGGRLQPVLDTIKGLKERGKWVEIITLVVPEFNDSDSELRRIADFIASVDPFIPWHVSAFHADYKMTGMRRTSADDLLRAAEIGREAGLKYIYAGNIPGRVGDFESTCCHDCGKLLVKRTAYFIEEYLITGAGKCPGCGATIPGIWSEDGKPGAGGGIPRGILW